MREGWIQKRFDEVFDLQMGKTPDRKNYDFFEGDNVWVSIRDLTSKEISDSNEHISDIAVKSTNIKKVSKGTVIMSFKLTVGKCAIAAKDLYTNEAIMAFNLKEGYSIDSSFLYYYLQGYKWEGANKAVMGMTLNKATISKHYVSIPPKSQQEAIVAELDEINSLLALKREQLQKYDNLAQSLFYEMFGDPVENEKGWEISSLSNICASITDGSHNPPKGVGISPYLMLSSKNIKDGALSLEDPRYLTESEYIVENKRTNVQKGDILLTIVGTIGRCCIFESSEFIVFQRSVAVLKPKNFVNSQYLMHHIIALRDNLENEAKGVAQKGIYLKQLGRIQMLLPPLPLQQQFASRIEQIESQKQQVQAAIEKLETLLASRMQYWFD